MPHKKRGHGHHHHHQQKQTKEEKGVQSGFFLLLPISCLPVHHGVRSVLASKGKAKKCTGSQGRHPSDQVTVLHCATLLPQVAAQPGHTQTGSSGPYGEACTIRDVILRKCHGYKAWRGYHGNGWSRRPWRHSGRRCHSYKGGHARGRQWTCLTGSGGEPEGITAFLVVTTLVKAPTSQVSAPTTLPSALSGTSGRTTASGTTVAQTKESPKLPAQVQVEVPSAAAGVKQAPDADPFDALASILPAADTVARPEPIYTGLEVRERNITSEKGVRCGEREDTLPPGYRLSDMGPPPADWKPQEVPKTMSTDDALDSLSAGFMSSTVPSGPPQTQDSVCTVSTGPTNFAKPPADKKPKMEKGMGNVAGLTATPFKKTPPTEKKIKGPSLSPDAVSALGDLLPADVPKPKSPKLRPEDMVSEGKHKEEEAVLVGEREDTIPVDHRFKKEDLEKLPAPKPEPTMDSGEALDILSGGFTSFSAAPAARSPPPPAQKVPAAAPPVVDDFSLEAGLTSTTAKKVESSALPPAPTTAGSKAKGGSMSQGALSALGDLLPADVPKPQEAVVRPEDIVSEAKHKEEDAVLVGERDDTIHPNYRVKVEDMKKFPAPKPEPTMATGEALDFLSGDLATTDLAPVTSSSAPCAKVAVENMSALDMLSGDFVAPTKASQAQAPLPSSAKKTAGGNALSLDALSALSDTLPADVPKPESPKLRPEDIVSEKKQKQKDAVLVGEREDTIPPDYRFKKEDLEKRPAPKPEPTMGTGEALDLLSGDFMTSKAAPAVQAPVTRSTAPPSQSSADAALDALAGDFVTSSAAVKVESSSSLPADAELQLAAGADGALDALSDTLMDIKPALQPEAPLPKNIVTEKKAVEERLIKMGERDDTLPPEYQPTEEDLKKMAEAAKKEAAQPKPTLDDKTALDLLSMDFSAPTPPASTTSCAVTTKLEPPVLDSDPLKPMSGPVLETLSSTLLPDAPEFKPKTDKAKGKSKSKSKSKKHAEEPPAADLPAQPSTDVVSASTKKGGKR